MADNDGDSFKILHGPERDRAIMELARRQHGHVARWQLLDGGVSQGLIAGRLRSGAWVACHAGVYCIGPRREDPVSRAAAAVLACGPGAVLSHMSAATLWGFGGRWTGALEVTAPDRRDRPGITAHRCRSLHRRDLRRQLGVPVTSPARTVLDIAPRLGAKALRRVVNDARLSGHLHLDSVRDVLDRNRFHPGTRRLRAFVDTPTNPTRSPFEDDFLAFLERYDLPMPLINAHVNGDEVDALFPEHRLIVELDGWATHRDHAAFEGDRDRDAEHLTLGVSTIRITKHRMQHTPDREAARLRAILERR